MCVFAIYFLKAQTIGRRVFKQSVQTDALTFATCSLLLIVLIFNARLDSISEFHWLLLCLENTTFETTWKLIASIASMSVFADCAIIFCHIQDIWPLDYSRSDSMSLESMLGPRVPAGNDVSYLRLWSLDYTLLWTKTTGDPTAE